MKKYLIRSFRIPPDLDKQLCDLSKSKSISRSKIIKNSLKKFFGGAK